jgi:hypothetical protein
MTRQTHPVTQTNDSARREIHGELNPSAVTVRLENLRNRTRRNSTPRIHDRRAPRIRFLIAVNNSARNMSKDANRDAERVATHNQPPIGGT